MMGAGKPAAFAQSLGNYGSLHGIILDPSNTAIPSAKITLQPNQLLRFSPFWRYQSIHASARTENDDLGPTRVRERNIFDAGIGMDDLLHTEGYKKQARLTVLNLANSIAPYNFPSTSSGTHFVTLRVSQVELKLVF